MRGKIWRIGDVLREEGERRKFGTLGCNDFDGCCTRVRILEHLTRGPTH